MSEMFVPRFQEKTRTPEEQRAFDLQEKFIKTMNLVGKTKKEKDEITQKRKDLKKEYLTEYPEQSEGIEIIFGMKRFMSLSDRLTKNREEKDPKKKLTWENIKQMLLELTEYQSKITNYIIETGKKPGGRKFLGNFWKLSEKLASEMGIVGQFVGLKKGILGQVASYKVLEILKFSPELPSPDLDAFYSVDLLTQKNVAIQVKSDSSKEPLLLDVEELDKIGIPPIVINRKGEKVFINARHYEALSSFKLKLEDLPRKEEDKGKIYRGFEFIIPIIKVNENDGTPKDEVVSYFKAELEKRIIDQEKIAA